MCNSRSHYVIQLLHKSHFQVKQTAVSEGENRCKKPVVTPHIISCSSLLIVSVEFEWKESWKRDQSSDDRYVSNDAGKVPEHEYVISAGAVQIPVLYYLDIK